MSDFVFTEVPTAEELFERVANNKASVSKHPWTDWGISKDEWVEYLQGRIRRDIAAPKKGDPAPDFTVERLDGKGKRTGEMIDLSSMFGRPIALLFGSYT